MDQCLEDLSRRLDDDVEADNRAQWRRFLEAGADEPIFTPAPRRANPPGVDWPDIHINDAQQDLDAMVLHQLKMVSREIDAGGGRLNVRCNYGTGILPTMLGCALYEMPRETRTLPTAIPVGGERIGEILDAGVPEPAAGLGGEVLRCAERFAEVFEAWPAIGRNVELYHPDIQGPMDVAEVVWGSGIFVAFYDEPDRVEALLELITQTYLAFMRHWDSRYPAPSPYTAHWGLGVNGRLMIREDSLMNLSAEMYVNHIRRFDQRLLSELGGGAVHFCGRGSHYISALTEMEGLTAINLSQPELNDMEEIYRCSVDKGLRILDLNGDWARRSVEEGRDLKGLVHCK
jgi:hypothetical protein